MASEISKIDSGAVNPYLRPAQTQTAESSNLSANPVPEVQVSSRVDDLIREAVQLPTSIDDNGIDAMIAKLKNGEYKIDYNKLAHSLVGELISKSSLPGDLIDGE